MHPGLIGRSDIDHDDRGRLDTRIWSNHSATQGAAPARRTTRLLPAIPVGSLFLLLIAFLHHTAGGSFAATDQAAPESAIQLSIHGGLLSLNVRDAALADLLRLIGDQASLRVTIQGTVNTIVTDSFTGLSLEEGIKRLGRGNGLVLIYAPAGGASGTDGLTDVWVYEATPGNREQIHAAATKQVPAPANAPVDRASQALGQSERSDRIRAVRELARQKNQTAAATLAQILAQDADPLVRAQAASALAKVGGAEAADALANALKDDDPFVRIQATRGFGKLEGDRAVQALRTAILDDPDPHVRREAAPALATLRSEEARSALQAAVMDPDPSVRQAAASALARRAKRFDATH